MARRIGVALFLWTLLMPAGAMGAPPTMTRDEIVDLAEQGVGYSYWWGHGCWRTDGQDPGSCSGSCPSCTHSGSYGADCSGFVAKAWQVPVASPLEQDAHPYSTANFRWDSTHWSQIAWDEALTADAFVYRNSSNTGGHIVLYDSGDPWGQVWVWEAKGCSYGILHDLKSLSSSYVAIRRDALSETPQTGTLRGVVYEDQGVGTADMSIRIPGATVECLGEGTVQAGSPDADWAFEVPPGSYTVSASVAGYLPGSRTCQVNAGQQTWCSIGLVPECTPDCSGRECGLDPQCGEPCGQCPAGDACGPDGQCETVQTCAPDCSVRVCGPDPVCGEPCGVCPADLICDGAGQCVPLQPEVSKVYGFVVAVPASEAGGDLTGRPPVPLAAMTLDGSAVGSSDRYGYFELEVAPGTHVLGAAAEGFAPGSATCEVGAHQAAECLVPVFIPGEGNPGVDAGPGATPLASYRTGCGCGAGGSGAGELWWGAMLLVLLLWRRWTVKIRSA